jgi:hypothetical protein
MRPLTEETRACFSDTSLRGPPGCEPFDFTIRGIGQPADVTFSNKRSMFHNQVPIAGPFGFELYKIGPENAGIEEYRKVVNGHTTLYSCIIVVDEGKRDAVCTPDGDRVASGAELHCFFHLRQLADITEIDADLRALVNEFTVKSGDGK